MQYAVPTDVQVGLTATVHHARPLRQPQSPKAQQALHNPHVRSIALRRQLPGTLPCQTFLSAHPGKRRSVVFDRRTRIDILSKIFSTRYLSNGLAYGHPPPFIPRVPLALAAFWLDAIPHSKDLPGSHTEQRWALPDVGQGFISRLYFLRLLTRAHASDRLCHDCDQELDSQWKVLLRPKSTGCEPVALG